MLDLSGKTALVTGASSGIGQATAIALAQAHCKVILHYNQNETGIRETATELEKSSAEFTVIQQDLLESNQLDSFCENAWSWQEQLDVLVNVAGGDVLTTDKRNWTFEEKLEFLWKLDVHSTLVLSRNLGERMKTHNQSSNTSTPSIINIGWDQAPMGQAGENGQIFSTTKGAIMAFTQSLAKSLAPNVRVNCVAPGWIKTSWGEGTSDYWDQRAKKESLLQRWGRPSDVAHVICMLASDSSEFVNGQTIAVNGGLGFGKE